MPWIRALPQLLSSLASKPGARVPSLPPTPPPSPIRETNFLFAKLRLQHWFFNLRCTVGRIVCGSHSCDTSDDEDFTSWGELMSVDNTKSHPREYYYPDTDRSDQGTLFDKCSRTNSEVRLSTSNETNWHSPDTLDISTIRLDPHPGELRSDLPFTPRQIPGRPRVRGLVRGTYNEKSGEVEVEVKKSKRKICFEDCVIWGTGSYLDETKPMDVYFRFRDGNDCVASVPYSVARSRIPDLPELPRAPERIKKRERDSNVTWFENQHLSW
ncbi:hypothetical protein BJX65DRAFT_291687 [Aspergillus insuetus]